MTSKRFKAAAAKVKVDQAYTLADACKLATENATTKFDESIDLVLSLGVDPTKADQNLRGSVPLPNGLGKKVRIAVFAKGAKATEALEAGAEVVGGDDLVEKVKAGDLDFDCVIATPDMMVQVGKVGKILGPKGLMPTPKTGTVTLNVADAVKMIKAGVAEYRVDDKGSIHAAIGKASFGPQKIKENAEAFIGAINKAKPATSKGVFLKAVHVSSSMGPGIKVDAAALR